ncbi:hypothetical protein U0070_018834 [Myodes glareolus]|uniref:Uncharacterized protein n=1 Tax=Myodes glareolus TaxID=447135 RepID=A0AAW0JVM8_MYOGA
MDETYCTANVIEASLLDDFEKNKAMKTPVLEEKYMALVNGKEKRKQRTVLSLCLNLSSGSRSLRSNLRKQEHNFFGSDDHG